MAPQTGRFDDGDAVTAQAASVIRLLERLSGPALAVLPSGRVLWTNGAARQRLAEAFSADGEALLWWDGPHGLIESTSQRSWAQLSAEQLPFQCEISSSERLFAEPVIRLDNLGEATVPDWAWLVSVEPSGAEDRPHRSEVSAQGQSRDVHAERLEQPGSAVLRTSDVALNTAMAAAQMGLWEWDQSTDQAFWRPEIYDLLELERGTGIEVGARFVSFVDPRDLSVVDQAIAQLQSVGRYGPCRFRIRTAKGNTRWLVSCAQVAPARGGATSSSVVGVNFDVTAEMEAQDRIGLAHAAGQRQQRIVESVLEHAPVGIAVSLNGEEHLSLVSKYGLAMIECSNDEGKRWDAWNVYHLDGKTAARPEEMALHRAARGEVIRSEEWFIRRNDGHLLPVSCDAGPITADDGQILGGVVSWYDVTPFKNVEQERAAALEAERRARAAAEEASQEKDDFLGIVSHELRTPLSAIAGWTAVMERKSEPAMQRRASEAISRNTTALARLVDDLLDATRLSAGKLDMTLADVLLEDVVAAAVDTVLGAAAQAGVNVEWTPGGAPCVMIRADSLRLQQALWNLLSNAVKFSPPGGLVLVQCALSSKGVQVQVTDFGQGIERTHLARVFDKFYQVGSGASRKSGLGLGLTLTKHIVEEHGGKVAVESAGLGMGTTFTVTLPTA